ncbi:hypothetical protein ACWCXH_23920 [Kitasatospora sp. NPDC001660]
MNRPTALPTVPTSGAVAVYVTVTVSFLKLPPGSILSRSSLEKVAHCVASNWNIPSGMGPLSAMPTQRGLLR